MDAVALSSTSVEIVWDDESSSETGFSVQPYSDDSAIGSPATVAAGTTDYVFSSATASTPYDFTVEATNTAAGSSPATTSNGVTTPATPASDAGPATPTLSAAASTSNPTSSIVLTYSSTDGSHLELEEKAPGDSSYHLLADLGSPAANTNQTYTTPSSLLPGTPYSFVLLAIRNGQVAVSSVATQSTASPATPDEPDYAYAAPTITGFTQNPALPGISIDAAVSTTAGGSGDYVQGEQEEVPADDPYNLNGFQTFQDAGGAGLAGINPDGTAGDIYFDSVAGWDMQVRYAIFTTASDGSPIQLSPYSAWQTVQIDGDRLDPATNLTAAVATGDNVTLNWTASDGDSDGDAVYSYSIYAVTNAGTAVIVGYVNNGDTTTATVPAASNANGMGYSAAYVKYFVIASAQYGDVGDSLYSNYANAPAQPPAAPQNLVATPFDDSTGQGIHLTWQDESDNETGFTITRSTSSNFSTDLQTFTVGADVTSYTDAVNGSDTSVQPGVTYYYGVQANNPAGGSGYSNTGTTSATLVLPTVSVTALDPNATAAGPDGNPQDGYFDFHRTGDDTGNLTVNVSDTGTTAVAGTDYSGSLPTTVTFPAGKQDVIVPVTPVNTTPGDASIVQVSVAGGTNYASGGGSAEVNLATHGLSVTLDGGATDDVLIDSAAGTQNLQPLTYAVPADAPAGTEFTLSIDTSRDSNAANLVDVWASNPTSNPSATPLLGDGADSYSWTVGQSGSAAPPTTMSVGAIGGSSAVGDIIFKITEIAAVGVADALSNGGAAEGLTITYNNAPVVDGTAFPIGALINFKAVYSGPGVASIPSWTVEGPTLSSYDPDADVQRGPVPISTTGASINVAWTDDGAGDDGVKAQVTVGDQTFSCYDLVSVLAPTVTLTVPTKPVVTYDDLLRTFGVQKPANADGGAVFQASVTDPLGLPQPASGQWEFVQVMDEDRTRDLGARQTGATTNRQQLVHNGTTVLDGTVPYGTIPGTPAVLFAANGLAHTAADSPLIDLQPNEGGLQPFILSATMNDAYHMYVFYRAGGAYNGVWVPVGVIDWFAKGKMSRSIADFYHWHPTPGSFDAGVPSITSGPGVQFPTWNGNSQPLTYVDVPST